MKSFLLSVSLVLLPLGSQAGDFAPFPLSAASNGCNFVLIPYGFECHPDPLTGRPIITPSVHPFFPPVKPDFPIVKPDFPIVKPDFPIVKPDFPIVKPDFPPFY